MDVQMLRLTTKIVVAYLEKNSVGPADVPDLIHHIYAALERTGLPAAGEAERAPSVPVKKSVRPDAVTCLECGSHHKMLKRHLATAHGLSVEDYRVKWGLPADYPMVAPEYAQQRSQLALKIGLGRKKANEVARPPAELRAAEDKPRHRYPASRWSKPS